MLDQDLDELPLPCGGLGKTGFEVPNKENKVPTFSAGFNDQPVSSPLTVPETKEEYIEILKDRFNFT